jgi:hypothetical protein
MFNKLTTNGIRRLPFVLSLSKGLFSVSMDLLASPVLEVAVAQIETDLPATLESLHMGFLPVPGLDARKTGRAISNSLSRA